MAKTLIGNVKGKDGRGISKIEKTSTDGVVDMYTITYTDGTTTTYEVRNSDSVALQRQIVPSAAVESSATASQSYSAGDYVVVDGVLRRVTASIARGSTISDSNSTATTVAGELATLAVPRKQTRLGNKLMCYVEGGICIVSVDYLPVSAPKTQYEIGTLPDGLKPLGHASSSETGDMYTAYIAPLRHRGDDSRYGQLMVTNSGKINVWADSAESDGYYYGILVFPVTRP